MCRRCATASRALGSDRVVARRAHADPLAPLELLHIEPLIWCRIQIPGDCTFWGMHVAIQSAFAWNDTHLHEFRSGGHRDNDQRLGIPLDDCDYGPHPSGLGAPSRRAISLVTQLCPRRNTPGRGGCPRRMEARASPPPRTAPDAARHRRPR
ncbi:MAG: hypothetical protein EPO46_12160 [Lysobacter sp.]|nr:MAG: hypothetical protein EPO46_12160 [Lysobacter sp.]